MPELFWKKGELGIRVTKVGDATRLRQIVQFVDDSEALKGRIQTRYERLADLAMPFTL